MPVIDLGVGLALAVGAGAVAVAGWLAFEPLRNADMEPGSALVAATIGLTVAIAGGVGISWATTNSELSAESTLFWAGLAGIVAIVGVELAAIAAAKIDLEAARRDAP